MWTRTSETAGRLRGRIETVIDAAQALGHVPDDKANPAAGRATSSPCCPTEQAHPDPPQGPALRRRPRVRETPAGRRRRDGVDLGVPDLTATRSSETLTRGGASSTARRTHVNPEEAHEDQQAAASRSPTAPSKFSPKPAAAPARSRDPTASSSSDEAKAASIADGDEQLLRRMKVMYASRFRTHIGSALGGGARQFELAELRLAHRVGFQRSRRPTSGQPAGAAQTDNEAWADYVDGRPTTTSSSSAGRGVIQIAISVAASILSRPRSRSARPTTRGEAI